LRSRRPGQLWKRQEPLQLPSTQSNFILFSDVAEIKASKNPKDLFRNVVIAVAMLFGNKENWEDARKFMGQTDCLKRLRTLDPMKDVPEKVWKRLRTNYLDHFDPADLEKASAALGTLVDFMSNSETYFYCQLNFEPKERSLKEAEQKLAKVESELAEKQARLDQIQEQVSELNRKLETSKNESESLKRQQDNSKKKLVRAEKLLSGLADERIRWKQTEEDLNLKLHNLIGNMLMTSAIISYLGPFTAPFRKKLMKKWDELIRQNKIPFSPTYKLDDIIEPIELREWMNYGLPADELSIENGIIMNKCQRWPLMIDPQSQANRWIKNMCKDTGISVIKLTNQNLVRTLSLTIQTGGALLIENVDETLDPILEPVLMKEITHEKGKSYKIKIGADEIQYNQDFKLYITSKRANPHYVPEIVIKVTLINFTVTPGGLEDQLLVDVIKNERPELEEERDSLIVKISDYNRQLQDLQNKILRQISESQDDILENDEIIITLEASKMTSQTINKGMADAKETSEKINISREAYRPIAQRGSILYFVIASLSLIDPMYQYSLEFFISLFNRRLANSQKSDSVPERVDLVIADITESFYNNICRGLFEKHKLMYSFLIATSIAMASDKINHKEWQYFSMGSYGELMDEKGKPEFLDDHVWRLCKNLEKLSYTMANLTESMQNPQDSGTWQKIIESEDPLAVGLPPAIEAGNTLSKFQRLLIYYTLSKEKLILFIKEFVKTFLGKLFIESPPFDLKASFADSTAATPIIFVLSPGADPMSNLRALAKELDMDGRFRILSLGQGQGPKAEEYIKMGRINGDWICLQNCHLAATWMTELERIQENQGDVLQDYRLWLTSMPTDKFPVSVLQSGVKITNEPPRGIKANIKRSYLETDEDWYNRSSKPEEFKTLFFSLSLFHAVILERRKFGAIGWNIPYGWMNSDLETCRMQLKMYLDQQPTVPYDTLSFLIAVINYGGRVTDNKDERLIKAILSLYFTPEVMKTGYKFSDSGKYYVPQDLNINNVRNYIEDLPLEDDPEVN
jgi:dynein heavy chain